MGLRFACGMEGFQALRCDISLISLKELSENGSMKGVMGNVGKTDI